MYGGFKFYRLEHWTMGKVKDWEVVNVMRNFWMYDLNKSLFNDLKDQFLLLLETPFCPLNITEKATKEIKHVISINAQFVIFNSNRLYPFEL